jgi:peptide/nickel transport system permease protein
MRQLWINRRARFGLILLGIFIVSALFAPWIAPYSPTENNFTPNLPPSPAHLLGTTQFGQDVFSQLIWGGRVSLLVGAVAGALATLVGVVIGLISGFLGGLVDESLSLLINVALVLPSFPLMVVISAYFPVRGVGVIIFVIALTGWAWGARVKRAQVMTLRERDFIRAAIFAGDSFWRIIFREILPNMISLVAAAFIGAAMGAILGEAGLEFLGFGNPQVVSWGTMLYWAQNASALVTGQWAWIFAPGLALALVGTALAFINFGIDQISNPRLEA